MSGEGLVHAPRRRVRQHTVELMDALALDLLRNGEKDMGLW